jgi:hypothetical protein
MKLSMLGKTDFIQNHSDRYMLKWAREMGSSKYGMGKWEGAKGQCGVRGWETPLR